jgi:asparagine synthase (glutamine-hydrolysing)
MTYGNGRFWITLNGEIYNYKELRQQLENDGAVFTTNTDTEVILASWVRWGIDAVHRFRGMFAFGLWDRQERRLVLVRDRMGIKPLLWAEVPHGLIFASELKALLASGLVDPVLEPRGIFDLLATGSVCQPGTMIHGVRNLEPGTCLVVGPEGLRESIRYWDAVASVTALRSEFVKYSYADGVCMVRDRLEEACRYHLVADVRVGSFLSGGVDSTAITALMARQVNEPVKSFSVGFENIGEFKHELAAARTAANHIGCDHTEVIITGRDVEDNFNDLVNTIDQPSHDGANAYFVSRAAHGHVKVVLSGLGGDELFAGYPHFALLQSASRSMPSWIDGLLRLIHRLRPNRLTHPAVLRQMSVLRRYAQLRRGLSDDDLAAALTMSLQACFRPGFVEEHLRPLVEESFEPLSQISLLECRHYLLDTLLRDADAMSMGHGLEVRPVMLDHVLVEHALALPPKFKIHNGHHKAALKDAVVDLLPPEILKRPKTGFELPLGYWVRSVLGERLRTILKSPSAHALFRPAFLESCLCRSDDPDVTDLLWTLLVLLSWMDTNKIKIPVQFSSLNALS